MPQPQDDFNENAPLARHELDANWKTWSAYDVGAWWERWFVGVGHKRLGRMLMEVTGTRLQFSSNEGEDEADD